jgi:hypothetical protein
MVQNENDDKMELIVSECMNYPLSLSPIVDHHRMVGELGQVSESMAGAPPGKDFAARVVPLRLTRRALSGRDGYVARAPRIGTVPSQS